MTDRVDTERPAAGTTAPPTATEPRFGIRALRAIPPIWFVLIVVLVGVVWRDPTFAEPPSLMAFLKRSAPLLAVALGELFVIVAGEFDLSVGALMTACVVVASRVGEGDPSRTWWVLLLIAALSVLVGLVN